jgi:hypothetical protein
MAAVEKYKLAYISPDDNSVLKSDMFSSLQDLLDFRKKMHISNYFVMENTKKSSGHYEWKMLNKGMYVYYRVGMFLKNNWIGIVSVLIFLGFVWYYKRKSKLPEVDDVLPPSPYEAPEPVPVDVPAPVPPTPAPAPVPGPVPVPPPIPEPVA